MRAADLWWLHPGRIVCLALLPIYLSFLSFDFTRVVKNVYVPSGLYWWGLALLVCLFVGIQWALVHAERRIQVAPPLFSRGVMMLLLGGALMAYAIWFGPLLARPQALMELVAGGRRAEVRDTVSTMPGVTTLTQFGVAFAIAYGLKCSAGVQRVSFIEHAGFVVLLLLTLFRAFAWAERLATIEYLVCFGVARMAFLPIVQPSYRRAAQVLPAAAALAMYGAFTATEYFRSWDYYVNEYDSIWAFTLDRLVTYYATATNNGIGELVETRAWPYYNGAFAFQSIWIMPGLGAVLQAAFGDPRVLGKDFLEIFARPEFNSPTAFFRVVMDFGYAGSALFFLLLGWLLGQAYAGFRCGRLFGLLMFPVFVLYLSEALRFSYFAESRCAPLLLGLGILALDVRRQRWLAPGAWSRRESPAQRP